ncbi:MAG: hypothetical protein DRO05_01115 [Thermoproteota archaeon]|nr:MAG: hypothetical protein DRO05_01115 [Candidatus Korarchaeota archaeon]
MNLKGRPALVGALRGIGLTETQAKVYTFLLEKGTSTAKEAAAETGVPVERIYRTFEQLHELGLIKYESSRPIRYSPVPPEIALKDLYVRRSLELKDHFQNLLKCMGFIPELVSIREWLKEDILILREEDVFLGLLKDLLEATNEFLAIFSQADRWLFGKTLTLLKHVAISSIRLVLPSSDWVVDWFFNLRGLEVRISTSRVSGFLVNRKNVALVGRKDHSSLILVILGTSLTDPLVHYLESRWLASIPIEVALGGSKDKRR